MAEFCLECLNKMNQMNLSEKDVVLSDDLDLCESCGEMKYVVINIGYHNSFVSLENLFQELFCIISRTLHFFINLCKKMKCKKRPPTN